MIHVMEIKDKCMIWGSNYAKNKHRAWKSGQNRVLSI